MENFADPGQTVSLGSSNGYPQHKTVNYCNYFDYSNRFALTH